MRSRTLMRSENQETPLSTESHGDATQSLFEKDHAERAWSNHTSKKKTGACPNGVWLTHQEQGASEAWSNNWDGNFHQECGANEALVAFRSKHDNRKEDRRWKIICKPIIGEGASLSSCSWDATWSAWDGTWTRPGATDRIITGMTSEHNNRKEDRKFKFRSCQVDGVTVDTGEDDPSYKNNWDGQLNDKVAQDQFYTRVSSTHDNRKEDRRFKFRRVKFCMVPTDCGMSEWGEWGPCDGETQTRERTIETDPKHGGTQCGETEESQDCTTTTEKQVKAQSAEDSADRAAIPSLFVVTLLKAFLL